MTNILKYSRALFAIMALVVAVAANAAAFDGESQYAKLDGARVHYKSYGKGKDALVLVHGWSFPNGTE